MENAGQAGIFISSKQFKSNNIHCQDKKRCYKWQEQGKPWPMGNNSNHQCQGGNQE